MAKRRDSKSCPGGSSPSAPGKIEGEMNIFKKGINFLKEVKQELSKVSWSTRQELFGATTVVIVITFIMAIFIGSVDLSLSKILSELFK